MTFVSLALTVASIILKALGFFETAQQLDAGAAKERAKQLEKQNELLQKANEVMSGPVRDKQQQLDRLRVLRDGTTGDNK